MAKDATIGETKVDGNNVEYIKDRSLVERKVDGNKVEYIIKKQGSDGITKLSHALTAIPPGIIYKDETGMGATTLELRTCRHSIIVEPVKVTASSKVTSYNENAKTGKEEAKYVGSGTKQHSRPSDEEILSYLQDKEIEYKKVCVVADSLSRVIQALKKISEKEYEEYFLLIDEVDSFQLDSSFRNNMEACIDVYKTFPIDKRALLSATHIDFSDPDLKNEPQTFIKYDFPNTREINVWFTNNLKGGAVDMITTRLQTSPNEKVMVAFNSVSGCFDLAEYLVKEKVIEKKEIKIMCSNRNEDKEHLKPYFYELKEDKLPVRLTFITSAYFTGFDLHEQFHLISLSGNTYPVHSLSDKWKFCVK